jgi:hypothetical protein
MTRKTLLSTGGFLGALAGYQLLTRGVGGPFTGMLLYGTLALGIGCCIVGEVIAFRERKRRGNEEIAGPKQPKEIHAVSRPEWLGDPVENRRRLKVIGVVFAVLGTLLVGFLLMQSRN